MKSIMFNKYFHILRFYFVQQIMTPLCVLYQLLSQKDGIFYFFLAVIYLLQMLMTVATAQSKCNVYLIHYRPVARLDFRGCGTPESGPFGPNPLIKTHFWPTLCQKVDLLADLGWCVAPRNPPGYGPDSLSAFISLFIQISHKTLNYSIVGKLRELSSNQRRPS